MTVCPTCNYSWSTHDERDAQRCYAQWVFREASRSSVRASDLRAGASPAWLERYAEPRRAA